MASQTEVRNILPALKAKRIHLKEICIRIGVPEYYKGHISLRLQKLIKNGEVAREPMDLPYNPFGYWRI